MKHHPEQLEDEIYMGNAKSEDVQKSSWRSSRLGNIALCRNGSPVYLAGELFHVTHYERLRPWFITVREVQNKIESLRNFGKHSVEEQIALFQKMIDTRTAFDNVSVSV